MINIFPILMSLAVFIFPIGLIVGVIFLILGFTGDDEINKKKKRRIGLWSIFGPVLALFILVTIWGLISVFTKI